MSLASAALLLILVFAPYGENAEAEPAAGAHAELEGDLHWTSLRFYLQEPTEPLRHEVLLVGDGDKMRFWPMWSFYKYLVSSISHKRAPGTDDGSSSSSSSSQQGQQSQGSAGQRQQTCNGQEHGHARSNHAVRQGASMVTLITPGSHGFQRGMACDEAVATFASTCRPLLYFLVSPGDQPLILSGAREYPGPKVLEVEDMEGEARLLHLITANHIDFVVYRYLSPELLALQDRLEHYHASARRVMTRAAPCLVQVRLWHNTTGTSKPTWLVTDMSIDTTGLRLATTRTMTRTRTRTRTRTGQRRRRRARGRTHFLGLVR